MTSTNPARLELDLSGLWQLAFDPGETGLVDCWTDGHWPDNSERIQVPSIWNIDFPDAEGIGFYRKVFDLPPGWEGRAVQLHFGGVSYRAEVWLNGRFAGSHMRAYTSFSLDITSLVHTGLSNELIVRVASLSRIKAVDGMVLNYSAASKQGWYYTFGGLWGKVYLDALPLVSFDKVSIDPDLHHEVVQVEVALNNRHLYTVQAGLHLHLLAPDGGSVSDQTTDVWLHPGMNRFAYQISVPEPYAWDCDHPHLYQMVAEICEAGGQTDRTSTAFGMRDFTVQNGQFILNGGPIYIRGVILQPHYPVNLVAPPDPEMMAREITLVKEAGFNLIRVYLRPAAPGYLELADRMGILIYAETSLGWILDSPRLLEHGRREVQEMISRERNHPSVVFWGIYNENRAAAALSGDALVRFARSLDPTRVVVDNSGGTMAIDQDFGWVDRATMVPNRESERQEIQDLHLYLGGQVPEPVYAWVRALGKDNRSQDLVEQRFGSKVLLDEFDHQLRSYHGKIFVSELGCGGMSDLEETVEQYQGREHLTEAREMIAFRDSLQKGFFDRGLDRIFGTVKELVRQAQEIQAAGNTRHIEAVLANPRISGYILTQLNDVAWEFHAGILDIWRRPKLAYAAASRLNQPHVLILNTPRQVISLDSTLASELTLVNQVPLRGTGLLSVKLFDPDGKEAFSFLREAPASAGINRIGKITPGAYVVPGKYRLEAQLENDLGLVAQTSRDLWALPPVDLAGVNVGIQWIGKSPARISNFEDLIEGEKQKKPFLIAYPKSLNRSDWDMVLEEVAGGRTAALGPLQPDDEAALALLGEHGVILRLYPGIGNWMGCYHWVPSSQLFSGLPAGGLAGEAYVDVRPHYVMSELRGEVLAGSFNNSQTRREPASILWYSDVESVPLGKGRLIFCQYRIFDKPGENPLADRLLANLVSIMQGQRR